MKLPPLPAPQLVDNTWRYFAKFEAEEGIQLGASEKQMLSTDTAPRLSSLEYRLDHLDEFRDYDIKTFSREEMKLWITEWRALDPDTKVMETMQFQDSLRAWSDRQNNNNSSSSNNNNSSSSTNNNNSSNSHRKHKNGNK